MERVLYRRGGRLKMNEHPYVVDNGRRMQVRIDLPENSADWYGAGMAKLYHVEAHHAGVRQPILTAASTQSDAAGIRVPMRIAAALLALLALLLVLLVGQSTARLYTVRTQLEQTEDEIRQAEKTLMDKEQALQIKINSINVPSSATEIGMLSSASMKKTWLTLDSGIETRSAAIIP